MADAARRTPMVVHIENEQQAGPEESLARIVALATRRNTGIRMRVSIQLWDAEREQYNAWKGQIWKVDTENEADTRDVKECLELLFDALSVRGTTRLKQEMEEVLRRVKGVRGVVTPGTSQAHGEHEEQTDGNTYRPHAKP